MMHRCQFPVKVLPPNSINMLCLNIRSLRGKIGVFTDFIDLNVNKFHIIILNETWLREGEQKFFNLPEYESFHSVRRKIGGGVAIFVLKSFSDANLVECFEEDNCNYLTVNILNHNFNVFTSYRPPDANVSDFLKHVDSILEKSNDLFFYTDSNLDLFKQESVFTKRFLETIENNGHNVMNSTKKEFFTRLNRLGNDNTCIDQICSNFLHDRSYSFFIDDNPDLETDHKALFLSFLIEPKKFSKSKFIVYEKINHDSIKNQGQLLQIPSESLEQLSLGISKVFELNTLSIRVKNRFLKPYMTNEILKLRKIRDRYASLSKKFPNDQSLLASYKSHHNKVVSLLKKSKKAHYKKVFFPEVPNYRIMWKHLNALLRNKAIHETSFLSMLKIDGNYITNRLIMADALNCYFINGVEEIRNSIINDSNLSNAFIDQENYNITFPFSNIKCSVSEVIEAASTLKNSKSKDSVGLSNIAIKFHIDQLASPLSNLFNSHMDTGIFPNSFKSSMVKPLHKGGDKTILSNYRPISLLPIMSKLFEKIILSRIQNHLKLNQIIDKCQFGFVERSNTETAAVNLVKNIYNNIEKRKSTGLLLIDFRKAFECLDHELLSLKIKKLGFSKKFSSLIDSFLKDRNQKVILNTVSSSDRNCRHGVPQGSILGPCLFLIYINSLSKQQLKGKLQLYADDSAIVYGEDDELKLKEAIEYDLLVIDKWLSAHKMAIHPGKTVFLIFNVRKNGPRTQLNPLQIFFKGSAIEQVNKAKFLGLTIDENLTFRHHIAGVRNKIIPLSFAIKRMNHLLSKKLKNQLYYAYIYPHLTYMNPIWSAASESDRNSIFIAKKKALKCINNLPHRTPSKTLFSELILPFPLICDLLLIIMMFKFKHSLLKCNHPLWLVKDIQKGISTRRGNDFYIAMVESKVATFDVFYRGFRAFNQLDEKIKIFRSPTVFKNRLTESLFHAWNNN